MKPVFTGCAQPICNSLCEWIQRALLSNNQEPRDPRRIVKKTGQRIVAGVRRMAAVPMRKLNHRFGLNRVWFRAVTIPSDIPHRRTAGPISFRLDFRRVSRRSDILASVMYSIRHVAEDHWSVIDDNDDPVFRGTLQECEDWLDHRENVQQQHAPHRKGWFGTFRALFGRSMNDTDRTTPAEKPPHITRKKPSRDRD